MSHDAQALAASVGLGLLGPSLGRDVGSALRAALSGGAVFADGHDALSVFRSALAVSIRDIESHPRGRLLREFLTKGPYERNGAIPKSCVNQYVSDADVASAIAFIYSHMVNSFQGAVAEMLAANACLRLIRRLQRSGRLPKDARLYVGDSVDIRRTEGRGFLKGADIHVLTGGLGPTAAPGVAVVGVAEVKSYIALASRVRRQLDLHARRAKRGLRVCGVYYPAESVSLGYGKDRQFVRIAILPSNWRLPRLFRFEDSKNGRVLRVDAGEPPRKDDEITQVADGEWRITLRWSIEALAEAAHEMTFWYMGRIGEVIYRKSAPKGWERMTLPDAGRNAAKMMLYYAILRARSRQEEQRAIALYNSYGYGYSLGMNYKNSSGKREMLWPQDLDEILSSGTTGTGCALR